MTPSRASDKTRIARFDAAGHAPSDDLVIELPPETPQLVLQFAHEQPADVRDYTLDLELPDGTRSSFEHLLPGADTLLSLALSASTLSEGRYRVRLVAIGNDGSRRDAQNRYFVLKRTVSAPR